MVPILDRNFGGLELAAHQFLGPEIRDTLTVRVVSKVAFKGLAQKPSRKNRPPRSQLESPRSQLNVVESQLNVFLDCILANGRPTDTQLTPKRRPTDAQPFLTTQSNGSL